MSIRRSMFLAGSVAALALAMPAAALAQAAAPAADTTATPPPMLLPAWGFNAADLDRSVKPGDDFDSYVNGKWKEATPIPAKYPDYGVSRNLVIGAEKAVREIIADSRKTAAAPGSIEQKVA